MKSFRELLRRYPQGLTGWLLHARDRHTVAKLRNPIDTTSRDSPLGQHDQIKVVPSKNAPTRTLLFVPRYDVQWRNCGPHDPVTSMKHPQLLDELAFLTRVVSPPRVVVRVGESCRLGLRGCQELTRHMGCPHESGWAKRTAPTRFRRRPSSATARARVPPAASPGHRLDVAPAG